MIRPKNDRIVARRVDMQEHLQKSTIIHLGTERAARDLEYRLAVVMAVGPGAINENGQRIPVAVSEGQQIMYRKFDGIEMDYNKEEIVILKESEILGVVETEK